MFGVWEGGGTAGEVKTATPGVVIGLGDCRLQGEAMKGGGAEAPQGDLSTSDSNTLQWVELIGMPTFDATSTVSALITSMQNPLQRQTGGETERWKTGVNHSGKHMHR